MRPARIGWATPWNVQSAIAQSASEVAAELGRRGHHITVLRTEVDASRDIPARPSSWPVRFLADVDDDTLHRDFDVVVAQIGDHLGFHGALLSRLDSVPVVGVFHDLCVAHLLHDWMRGDPDQLRAMVRSIYGGTPAAEAPFDWHNFSYLVETHPMIEWVAARTVAAVAHAQHYAGLLERSCSGPVAVIPLAFEVSGLPEPPPPHAGGLTVAVIGHANRNKRIDQILLAISASSILRERCRLRVIGPASPEARHELEAYAGLLGIAPPVFTGWVSDGDLRRQLRDVDVISCLRHPVLEGASASLITALTSGRPTLVSNNGAYAEVPDDAVLKCVPGREALDVMLHLESLIEDPALGLAIGARGRAFIGNRHTAGAYVDALEPLLERCIAARPRRAAEHMLATTLSGFGLGRDDPAVGRTRSVIEAMLRP